MPERELDGAQVAGPAVDQHRLRATRYRSSPASLLSEFSQSSVNVSFCTAGDSGARWLELPLDSDVYEGAPMRILNMQPSISAPSAERSVIDHAANEPESPKADGSKTSYDRELERTTRARAYFADEDPINAAIRRDPTRSMLVAGGVGFILALLVR